MGQSLSAPITVKHTVCSAIKPSVPPPAAQQPASTETTAQVVIDGKQTQTMDADDLPATSTAETRDGGATEGAAAEDDGEGEWESDDESDQIGNFGQEPDTDLAWALSEMQGWRISPSSPSVGHSSFFVADE